MAKQNNTAFLPNRVIFINKSSLADFKIIKQRVNRAQNELRSLVQSR
jgi:hypothetical protein